MLNLRGFGEATIWGRSRMKNICSLFVQVHRKLGNTFVPLTHTGTFAELMQITNTVALAKFVTCWLY
jgi:hypothetical protein